LYKELRVLLTRDEINKDSCLDILTKLEEGNKV